MCEGKEEEGEEEEMTNRSAWSLRGFICQECPSTLDAGRCPLYGKPKDTTNPRQFCSSKYPDVYFRIMERVSIPGQQSKIIWALRSSSGGWDLVVQEHSANVYLWSLRTEEMKVLLWRRDWLLQTISLDSGKDCLPYRHDGGLPTWLGAKESACQCSRHGRLKGLKDWRASSWPERSHGSVCSLGEPGGNHPSPTEDGVYHCHSLGEPKTRVMSPEERLFSESGDRVCLQTPLPNPERLSHGRYGSACRAGDLRDFCDWINLRNITFSLVFFAIKYTKCKITVLSVLSV